MRFIAYLSCALVLTSCAAPVTRTPEVSDVQAEIEAKKQRELVVKTRYEEKIRLNDIAYRVLRNGQDLCGEETSYRTGLHFWNIDKESKWAEAFRSVFNLSDLVKVAVTSKDSPAQHADIRQGDILISVNDWPVPVGEDALEQVKEKMKELRSSDNPVTIKLQRGDQSLVKTLAPEKVCDYSVVLIDDQSINAYADGKNIIITRGMLNFTKTDEELALVLSHELAHNSMGHVKSKTQNAVVGGLIGLIVDVAAAYGGVNTQGTFTDIGMRAGAAVYSVDFEREADYVGIYFMAHSGYSIKEAPNFWRRMAIEHPNSIQIRTTHPTSPERFVALEKSIEEVNLKQQQQLALLPELKAKDKVMEDDPESKILNAGSESSEIEGESVALSEEEKIDDEASSDPISGFFKRLFKGGDEKPADNESE